MNLSNSHGGFAGKSLTEKIRDEVDRLYDKWQDEKLDTEWAEGFAQGRIDGLIAALAIITNTKEELHWDSAEARSKDRKRRNEQVERTTD